MLLSILRKQLTSRGGLKAASTFGVVLPRRGAQQREVISLVSRSQLENGNSDYRRKELNTQLAATADSIAKVEREIDKVCGLIEGLPGVLTSSSGGDEASLRIEEQLRREKEQLRREKEQLRDEKKQLRDEKKQLRTKEEQLRAMLLKHDDELRKSTLADEISGASFLTTPAKQMNASSFAKSESFILGFGHLPTSYRLDPTEDQRVAKLLFPSPAEVSAAQLMLPMGELGTLAPRMEHATEGVREILQECFDGRSMSNIAQSGSALSTLGLSLSGVVTSTSKPDFVWKKNGRVLGIIEVKGGESSSLVGLRQAAVLGTAVAMDLLQDGRLRPEEIVVPVVGINGTSAQFGSIIVLEPSFPTFVPVSGVLDLDDVEGNKQAAAFFAKASQCAQTVRASLDRVNDEIDSNHDKEKEKKSEKLKMVLDKDQYWIKELTEDKYSLGIGFFSSSEASHRLDVGLGLEHMGRVLTLLYRNEKTRGIPVFPLSVRSPHTAADNYLIVYENLAAQGFRIGTPNRIADERQYQRYLSALRSAVEAIHEAGVVHTDLYPSNIMWRELAEEEEEEEGEEGENKSKTMAIRIIDWDCSHCLAEGSFNAAVKKSLRNHKPTRSATLGVEHDLRYLRVLQAPRGHDAWEDDCWEALASNDANRINGAFYTLFPLP